MAAPSDKNEKARQRAIAKWGEGYSEAEYRTLERTYDSLAAEYRGAINPRLELNLIDISKWRMERDRCVSSGDTAAAKRYTDMIKATLDSEAMIVGDAKRVEAIRVDGLADRLEKMGMLKDGELLLTKVVEYIRTDRAKFQLSRDAVDAMMLSMINAYRFNNGLSELAELPEDMRVQDKLGEFLENQPQRERDLMLELGMVPAKEG